MDRLLTLGLSGPGVAESQFPPADLFAIFKPIETALQAIIAADGAHAANGAGGELEVSWWVSARNGEVGEAQMRLDVPAWSTHDAPDAPPDPLQQLVNGVNAQGGELPPPAVDALAEIAAAIPTERDVVRMRYDWTIVSFGRSWARRPDKPPLNRLHGWLWGVDSACGEARLQAQRENAHSPFAAILHFEQPLAAAAQRFERSRVCIPLFESGEPRSSLPTFHIQELEQHPCRHIPPDTKLFRWPTEDERINDPKIDEFIDAAYQARRAGD